MIVVCGEALVDLVPVAVGGPYAARPGGSPANVAVGLGRLGHEVTLLARLSEDPFGRLLRDHLTASTVDLASAVTVAEPTTLAVVSLDERGQADYAFYVTGAADGGWDVGQLPARLPPGAPLHVSGSLALAVPSMGAVVEALLERERGGRVLALDPNVRPLLVSDEPGLRARLDRWLGLVDLVKVSDEDLAWLCPGEPVEDVAARWRERGPAVVVVTRGGEGVHALGPAGPVDLPALPVQVADTVGAGDSFMGGLLAALSERGLLGRPELDALSSADLREALAFAAQVAAVTCSRPGADPPWRAELPGP